MAADNSRLSMDFANLADLIREFSEIKEDFHTIEEIMAKLAETVFSVSGREQEEWSDIAVGAGTTRVQIRGLASERQRRIVSQLARLAERALSAKLAALKLNGALARLDVAEDALRLLSTQIALTDRLVAELHSFDPEWQNRLEPLRLTMAEITINKWLKSHPRVALTEGLITRIRDNLHMLFHNRSLTDKGLDPYPGGALYEGLAQLGIQLNEEYADRISHILPPLRRQYIQVIADGQGSFQDLMDRLEHTFFRDILGRSDLWKVISMLFRARLVIEAYAVPEVIRTDEQLKAVLSFQFLLDVFVDELRSSLEEIGIEVIGGDIKLLTVPRIEKHSWHVIPHGESPLMRNSHIVSYLKNRQDIQENCCMDIHSMGYRTTWDRFEAIFNVYCFENNPRSL